MCTAPQISVIDDDESIRRGLSSLLGSIGLTTRTYDCAEDFLREDARQCSLLITDVQLPGLSGIDVLHELARRSTPIPVVVVSGQEDDAWMDTALAAGARVVLMKPINALKFIEIVLNLIKGNLDRV